MFKISTPTTTREKLNAYQLEYAKTHLAQRRYYNSKSSSKTFIKKYATLLDLKQLDKLLHNKIKQMESLSND